MQTISKKLIQAILIFCAFVIVFLVSSCPLQEVFGIPCPGCNMTTALYYLMLGNVEVALFYHPLVIVLLICIFIEVILYYRYKNFTNIYAKWIFWGCMVLFIVIYIYRMITIFPNIPMVYVEDNVFAKVKALFY